MIFARCFYLTHSVQVTQESFPDLDFSKIKQDLVSADEEKRALIIQALRWVGDIGSSDRNKEMGVSKTLESRMTWNCEMECA